MLLPYKPKKRTTPTKRNKPLPEKAVFNVTGGLDFSLPPIMIEDNFLSNCKNIYFDNGKIKNRPGYSLFGDNLPLDSAIRGISHLFSYDGAEYLIAYTLEKVYWYNVGTENWDDITDTAGDYTGDHRDRFSTETIYDDNGAEVLYVSTNRVDAVKKWNGAGNFDDLDGSPNKCRFLKNFNHHLMLFDVVVTGTRFPQRIDWSDKGLPETWTGGSSGNVHLAKTADFIVGAEIIRSQLAILKENSITMGTYVGGKNPFIFEENKIKGVGCLAGQTLISLGDKLVFLGEDNVYTFDGFQATPISKRIQSRLFGNLNRSKIDLSHATLLPRELGLYLLFVPSQGSDYADVVWVWDYKNDSWTSWEFDNNILCTGYYESDSGVKIGELLGKIGTFNWKIGTAIHDYSFSLLGDDNGNIYKLSDSTLTDNTQTISCSFETKSYFLGGLNQFARATSLDVYGKGNSLDIYASKNDGKDYEYQNTMILNDEENNVAISKINFSSDRVMFKLENVANEDFFEIDGWNIFSIPKGMKKKTVFAEEVQDSLGNAVYALNPNNVKEKIYVRN